LDFWTSGEVESLPEVAGGVISSPSTGDEDEDDLDKFLNILLCLTLCLEAKEGQVIQILRIKEVFPKLFWEVFQQRKV
jgi:hypothetical protein